MAIPSEVGVLLRIVSLSLPLALAACGDPCVDDGFVRRDPSACRIAADAATTTCLVGDAAGQCGGAPCDFELFVCVQCRDDDDCGGGTPVCSFGTCQAPCFDDGDCAALPGATCDATLNACVLPPAPACVASSDCVGSGAGSEVVCSGGLCGYP